MGSKSSYLKRNWKLIVNVVTVGALLVLIFLIRHQIIDTFNNLRKVNLWIIALMLPLQVANYHAQTKVYQHLFNIVGNKLKYWAVYRVALELNFVNHVFPSGGVSGISYFGVRLRRDDITGSKATLVQLMKLGLMFVSFEILLIFGLFVMAANGRANNLVVLAAGSISTLLVVGTFAFVYIFGSERRIHATFTTLTRFTNDIIRIVRPRRPDAINMARVERAALEFHNNYKVIETNYRELKSPFWWALLINVTEVAAVYVVYAAFGEWVNVGAIILGYAVANFAGLVSVLPGGVGIYEALMTGVLAAAGIPAALSLPVTVMYRVINTIIQVPPGWILYHQSLQKIDSVKASTGEKLDL
ncbi:MAG TPA: lysylphosphatidylglycerol synthase transmembrane domain-containing protein [Patescibacteria group bacterium]|nr:lysylphosphatidylglycerol synthase transmembrane domain-containing protein [Patescibacteria group bacterium]